MVCSCLMTACHDLHAGPSDLTSPNRQCGQRLRRERECTLHDNTPTFPQVARPAMNLSLTLILKPGIAGQSLSSAPSRRQLCLRRCRERNHVLHNQTQLPWVCPHCSEPKLDQTLPNMASAVLPPPWTPPLPPSSAARCVVLGNCAPQVLLLAQAARVDLNPDGEGEGEVVSYMDVVAASKRRPLGPLVGKLRSVKSASEIEVMKASAEISARAHAKVSECMDASSFVLPRSMLFG